MGAWSRSTIRPIRTRVVPHSAAAYKTCFDTGKMDGFIKNAEGGKKNCADPNDPECTNGKLVDVMGYKTRADIPNYWGYASAFTLLDHQFESDASWSWPMHQYMVSEWAALCTSASPTSCTSNIGGSEPDAKGFYSWTPLTYILDAKKVSWRYYLAQGTTPDCDNDEAECPPVTQLANVPSIWNPLPLFERSRRERADDERRDDRPLLLGICDWLSAASAGAALVRS